MDARYTVIPKDGNAFNKNSLSELVDLPQLGKLVAHGEVSVTLPVYHADPSMLIPDSLKSVTVADAKLQMKKHVLAWQDENAPEPLLLGDDVNLLEASARASVFVDFMLEYEDKPIMPKIANHALLKSLNHPVPEMALDNFRLALVGYMGHYAGEDLEDVFRKVVSFGVDETRISVDQIRNTMELAQNSFGKQKEAAKVILALQERPLSESEKVAELGIAMYEIGLDDVKLSAFAHRAESKEMQHLSSPDEPEPRRKMRLP
tara:strand:- start:144 stop:926 length:783 start_codon:yes stop_codon:yes gene_type:complete